MNEFWSEMTDEQKALAEWKAYSRIVSSPCSTPLCYQPGYFLAVAARGRVRFDVVPVCLPHLRMETKR